MYKYIGDGRSIPGAEMRDLTDAEMAAAEERVGGKGVLTTCQHPKDEQGQGHACLLYQHVPETAPKRGAAAEEE
jgi:hypothetical protein